MTKRPPPHAVEEWARLHVRRELGRHIEHHDDGSVPGMYDLRVGPVDAPDLAIEVTGAVDPVWTATWNMGPGRRFIQCDEGLGDWLVQIDTRVDLKRLDVELCALLQMLMSQGRENTARNFRLRRSNESLHDLMERLGVNHATRLDRTGRGEAYLTMRGQGGGVDTEGTSLPGWVSQWVREPTRADVLDKLERAGASECHVFIPVALMGAPWAVESYLTSEVSALPPQSPDLPSPLSGVWVAHTFGEVGVRWDRVGWRRFATGDATNDK